jgi:heme/copper-type cytochrome/quinol oxidase subunit 1
MGIVGGILGSSASMVIKFILIGGKADYHSYNVILTFHGLRIVFFFVIPILRGRFAN